MFLFFRKRTLIAAIFIGTGGICLAVCGFSYFYTRHFLASTVKTHGQIVEMKSGENVLFPVFTFNDANGTLHKIYSRVGSSPPAYQVGEAVYVLYPPNAPQKAIIDNWLDTWIVSLATGVLGVTYLPLGAILWYWPRIIQRFRRANRAAN